MIVEEKTFTGTMKPKKNKLAEWQLRRERFRIPALFPPRTVIRTERNIGTILSEIRGQEPAPCTLPAVLEERWAMIIGEQIAQHTHPVHLNGTRLTVYTDHPGWLTEVRRLPTQHLLKRISAIPNAPEIKEIRFQLDPAIRPHRN